MGRALQAEEGRRAGSEGLGLMESVSSRKEYLGFLKKDTLLIRWVNEFYLADTPIWEWEAKDTTAPFFKNLVRIRDEMLAKAGSKDLLLQRLQSFASSGHLSVGLLYDWLRVKSPDKPWGKLIWAHCMTPKHSFVLWMAAVDRLHTVDRMKYSSFNPKCALCGVVNESRAHLFFQCSFSREVWDAIRAWMGISRRPTTMDSALKWLKKDVKGKSWRSKAMRTTLACVVYNIWEARNKWRIEGDVVRFPASIEKRN